MPSDRQRQVQELYNSAIELPEEQRAAFLDSSCKRDETLRSEVESLLASGVNSASGGTDEAHRDPSDWAGKTLSYYEIREKLGAGGMGEVYRAHDNRLGRDVVIKILPRALAKDSDRLRRFEQEARAAAALNHPNILAIYDVGTAEGVPFLVLELLEGETLRERLRGGPLPGRKVIQFTLQLASGLAAAHDKGIIHRDLKPDNLFITHDGHLKILDFGLAKLSTSHDSPGQETLTSDQTKPGVVLGTVGYMAPEQARGLATDARSDIFSIGAIVYEMLTGQRAFHGPTAADTISAILSRDPPPFPKETSAVPGFERILRRCLEKDPNERFHSVRDVAFALEALSDVPGSQLAEPAAQPEGSSRSFPRAYVFAASAVALLLALGGVLLYKRVKPAPRVAREWQQLTNFPDSVVYPVLSPDGRMLAFFRGTDTFSASGDLYVKILPNGDPVQLTHDPRFKASPQFSPDGSRIAYSIAPPWDTWIVPVLGGTPQMYLPNASGVSWIDDQHLLFSEIKHGIHMAVVTGTANLVEKRDVYVPELQEGMAHHSQISPDRRWVVISTEMGPTGGIGPCRVVPFDGSSPGRSVGPSPSACTDAAWSPDGNWLFFSANAGHGFHLWRQEFPDGQPEQLTFGPTEEEGLGVAADGKSIVTAVGITAGSVWVSDASGERQIAFEGSARFPDTQMASRGLFSPDASKLFFLGRKSPQDNEELFSVDLTSGAIEQAAAGLPVANAYDISPDGKRVILDAFDSKGQPHIWLAALDRREPPRTLMPGAVESYPLFLSNDEIIFHVQEGGRTYAYRRKLDGSGRRKAIPDPIARVETISPDGQWLVTETAVDAPDVKRGVVAFNLQTGRARRVCYGLCVVRWSLDAANFYIGLPGNSTSPNAHTYVLRLAPHQMFPELPPEGFKTETDVARLGGLQKVGSYVRPGPDASHSAFNRATVHRNIFRIPLS